MSEFLLLADAESGQNLTSEHYFKRILAGNRDSVRPRLLNALQRLGYDILDDDGDEIRGRRGPRGWGGSYSSADVLDYPMTLIIKLKENGQHSTRATFDYLVKHPALSAGDKDVLTREAEAISSLATVRAAGVTCPACGIESADDSRFCRRCGAQIDVENNELELLRMSAEIRASHTSIVPGAVAAIIAGLFMVWALVATSVNGLVLSKGIWLLFIVGTISSWLSVVCISFGWNRVNRALRSNTRETPVRSGEHITALKSGDQFLQDHRLEVPSVTEGTTNLLTPNSDPRNTGEFSDDDQTSKIAG